MRVCVFTQKFHSILFTPPHFRLVLTLHVNSIVVVVAADAVAVTAAAAAVVFVHVAPRHAFQLLQKSRFAAALVRAVPSIFAKVQQVIDRIIFV